MAWWKARTRSVADRSDGSPATRRVPSARKCTSIPDAASSRPANPGQARTPATLRAARASSPKWASATGASMPAAAHEEPCPGRGIDQGHVELGCRRPPGDGQADDAAADDHDVIGSHRWGRGGMGPCYGRRTAAPVQGPDRARTGGVSLAWGPCTLVGPRKGQRRPARGDPLLTWSDPMTTVAPSTDGGSARSSARPVPVALLRPAGGSPPPRHRGPLRPPVRARRLRGGPGRRPPGPTLPRAGPPGRRAPSSTSPTGERRVARRTAATAPASSSRSPTPSTGRWWTSPCPTTVVTPPASPSSPTSRPGGRRPGPWWKSWPPRRGSTSWAGGSCRSHRRRSVRSPRPPGRRCTSCSSHRRTARP